jgi:hypothetical protein
VQSHIDHLVITAPSLRVGVEYLRRTLGVSPQAGGEHPRMGTHNCFVKLGERVYLEVISINPSAPRPNRPRWFELDEPDAGRPVRLATWVARTDEIYAAAAASPVSPGNVEPMSRAQLNWLITIAADGSLPLQGIAPTLIQWPDGTHPANTLDDRGCFLVRLEGFHPQAERVSAVLQSIGFDGDFSVSPVPPKQRPYLIAHIQTPSGMRQLTACDSSLDALVSARSSDRGIEGARPQQPA